jgi:hypothetical protein
LDTGYKANVESHMKFYRPGEEVYDNPQVELIREWYKTTLSKPTGQNPLLGDDLEGNLNENFKTFLPKDQSHPLLICGGSWELPALQKGNENRVFIRKAMIDTKTVVLVSVINVILPAGGHLAKEHKDTPEGREKAKKEMKDAMAKKDVFARFKITGPHNSDGVKPVGKYLDEDDLLFISNEDYPFMDIEGHKELETDPPDWKTLKMKKDYPSFTSGYYACFELKTPGTYIVDIDGSAPLAGHQDTHFDESKDKTEFHLDEKLFHNSARYVLEVKP